MINLLSPNDKKDIRAARVNTLLVRYMGIIAIAIAFIVGVLFVSFTILQQTKQNSLDQVRDNDVKADVYSKTRTQVESLSQSLSQAKTILDQEVRYSKVLTGVAALMPQGTIIESLTLEAPSAGETETPQAPAVDSPEIGASAEGLEQGATLPQAQAPATSSAASMPISLKVLAKSSAEAISLQNQFRSSPLIQNPNFQSVAEGDTGVSGYNASITMTFSLNPQGVR